MAGERRLLKVIAMAMLIALSISACAPRLQVPGTDVANPHLTDDAYVTADGVRLATRIWPATGPQGACAVIVALHGFNDYRNAFAAPSEVLNAEAVTVIAYDQRGFGEDPNAGIWAGGNVMASDLRKFVGLVRQRHPDTPLFVLGHSMGGAVALLAYGTGDEDIPAASRPDGLILVAPAVWGWSTMNPLYAAGLWLGAHTIPGHKVTGSGVDVHPSDNMEMLRGLARDPLVIKKTRIDSVYGLVNLMQEALDASPKIDLPMLLVYGLNDDIIRKNPIRKLRARLPEHHIYKTYEAGYHMLLRDVESARPIRDIADFVLSGAPFGGERDAAFNDQAMDQGRCLKRPIVAADQGSD